MRETIKIFISRSLSEDSPLLNAAENLIFEGKSLIAFESIKFDAPEADWVFFYSRNAVRYFFESDNYELYPYQYACMSTGTADELSRYVLDIAFVGKGRPKEVAEQFNQVRRPHEKVCFIRANKSMDSINKMVGEDHDFSVPVYDNQAVSDIPNDEFDILIFTSPMNVNIWFEKNEYKNEFIITIGPTTESAVKKFVDKNILVSDKPSEEELANTLKKLITNNFGQ